MNIEQAFHTAWAAASTLNALLPASKVWTGRAPKQTARPYGSIRMSREDTTERTSIAHIRDVEVLVQVFPTDYATGKAILTALKAAFEDQAYSTSDGSLEKVEHVSTEIIDGDEPDDTDWQFDVTFTAMCRENRA